MSFVNSPTLETTASVPLNPIENYFWRFEKDLSGAFRVALLLRVEGCIQADFLAAALQQVQRRHPKLRAAITESPRQGLRYQIDLAVPAIPFKIIDCDEGETPWREETRRLLQMEFPDAGPLAAVSVLRSSLRGCSEIILTMTHAIADGLSAIVVADDLLTEYAKAEARVEVPPPASLPLVAAASAKRSTGWRSQLRLLRRFIRLKREERQEIVTALPEVPGITPCSQWVHWVFSSEDTLKLVRRCRKEKVSLSAAMITAVCCGVMDCLNKSDALFRWQLPFDLREDLKGLGGPVTSQDIGCFMTNMNGTANITQQFPFWDLAKSVEGDIQFFLQHGGPSFGHNTALWLYGMATAANRLLGRPCPKLTPAPGPRATVLVNSFGVVNIKNAYGSIKPLECTLNFKNETIGPSLVMESLVLSNKLNIGFAADDLDPTFWKQLQAAVRKRLDTAAISLRS